jgi:hypothetical protein
LQLRLIAGAVLSTLRSVVSTTAFEAEYSAQTDSGCALNKPPLPTGHQFSRGRITTHTSPAGLRKGWPPHSEPAVFELEPVWMSDSA